MVTVLGFDKHHAARVVEVKDTNREEIEQMLKDKGWTNLIILEK